MWQILLAAVISAGLYLNYEPKTKHIEVITDADRKELSQLLTKI